MTHTIGLNKDDYNFIRPLIQIAKPGEKIKFHTAEGAFSIIIKNAINFLDIPQQDLKIFIDNTNPDSADYLVRNVGADVNREYDVYCITNDDWPDAPPKIIIIVP